MPWITFFSVLETLRKNCKGGLQPPPLVRRGLKFCKYLTAHFCENLIFSVAYNSRMSNSWLIYCLCAGKKKFNKTIQNKNKINNFICGERLNCCCWYVFHLWHKTVLDRTVKCKSLCFYPLCNKYWIPLSHFRSFSKYDVTVIFVRFLQDL